MVVASADVVAKLRQQVLDARAPISQRFRTLFSLRNCSGDEAREALEAGAGSRSYLQSHVFRFGAGPKLGVSCGVTVSIALPDVW